jgi:membrane-associated phospholipid phosphatase
MEWSTVAAPAARARRAALRWRPRVRAVLPWIGVSVYFVALGLAVGLRGLPTSRDAFVFWLLLGLLAASVTDVRRWFRGLLVDWLPFASVLFAYDLLRGYADRLFSAHVWPQLRADEVLFGGAVPTVWLQRHLWQGPAHIDWIDYLAWSFYLTHFFATLVVAACLWLFAARLFRRYMAMVIVLAVAGLATYALFPAVPPWMASRDGHLGHTVRIVGYVSKAAPIEYFGALWEHGTQYANNVAAMPSLHAAYAMLIALFFWPRAGWRWRIPLVAYALGMGFALVYTGEHYVSDVLAGWLYAACAAVGVEFVARRRALARA